MSDVIPLFGRLGARKGCRRATGARAWYERAIELEASDAAAAREAYRRAVRANPELADAWCNLGRQLHELGQVGDAEGCYRLALCAEREVAVYWFNLGVADLTELVQ